MKNKTVVISTYDDITNPYYRGGGAIAIHEVAKRLKDYYAVTVLSWNHTGKSSQEIDGVMYERIGFSFINPKVAMFLFQILLPFAVQVKKCDVWMESFAPPFTTSFLPVFTKKKVVGIVHMLAAEDMKRKFKIFPFSYVEKKGISKYQNVVATNELLAKRIESMSAKTNVSVISNGVDKVDGSKRKKNKNILFLGRIEIDQKGLDLLVKAFKIFNEKHSDNYQLVIAGSGANDQMKKLRSLIKESGLKKKVKIVGWVSGKDKESLLKKSVLMVIPSRFETYSITALEAMAYGMPIICFDIDGLKWVSKDAACKVAKFDTEEFARKLYSVVKSKRVLEKYQKFGPEYAKNFTWDTIAEKYQLYLSSLIAK